jgi:hypothetical protein
MSFSSILNGSGLIDSKYLPSQEQPITQNLSTVLSNGNTMSTTQIIDGSNEGCIGKFSGLTCLTLGSLDPINDNIFVSANLNQAPTTNTNWQSEIDIRRNNINIISTINNELNINLDNQNIFKIQNDNNTAILEIGNNGSNAVLSLKNSISGGGGISYNVLGNPNTLYLSSEENITLGAGNADILIEMNKENKAVVVSINDGIIDPVNLILKKEFCIIENVDEFRIENNQNVKIKSMQNEMLSHMVYYDPISKYLGYHIGGQQGATGPTGPIGPTGSIIGIPNLENVLSIDNITTLPINFINEVQLQRAGIDCITTAYVGGPLNSAIKFTDRNLHILNSGVAGLEMVTSEGSSSYKIAMAGSTDLINSADNHTLKFEANNTLGTINQEFFPLTNTLSFGGSLLENFRVNTTNTYISNLPTEATSYIIGYDTVYGQLSKQLMPSSQSLQNVMSISNSTSLPIDFINEIKIEKNNISVIQTTTYIPPPPVPSLPPIDVVQYDRPIIIKNLSGGPVAVGLETLNGLSSHYLDEFSGDSTYIATKAQYIISSDFNTNTCTFGCDWQNSQGYIKVEGTTNTNILTLTQTSLQISQLIDTTLIPENNILCQDINKNITFQPQYRDKGYIELNGVDGVQVFYTNGYQNLTPLTTIILCNHTGLDGGPADLLQLGIIFVGKINIDYFMVWSSNPSDLSMINWVML